MLMYCCDITVVMVGWVGGGNGVFFIDGLVCVGLRKLDPWPCLDSVHLTLRAHSLFVGLAVTALFRPH